jgi:enoyl-CoA hydratase/carnithine racemase
VSGPWRALELSKEDGVATVVLNRPGRLNAYNLEMRDELWECTAWLAADPDVGACVFAGAGRAFCSGADLAEFGTAPSVVTARMVRRNRPVWTRILELPQVTIAALHGYVLGAGLELALACDLRFVARGAQLGMPETGLGFVPPAGGTQLLPRTTGVGLAKRLLYTRERVAAEDAVGIGLASRLLADREAVVREAQAAARAAALIPAGARARLKSALRLR